MKYAGGASVLCHWGQSEEEKCGMMMLNPLTAEAATPAGPHVPYESIINFNLYADT